MKNIIFILSIILFVSGCSHHITSYSKGYGIDFSWQPDSFTPSIKAGEYEFLFSMNRENGNVRYTTNNNSETKLEIKTGPTINGYIRDILNNPDLNESHVGIIEAVHDVDISLPNDLQKQKKQ